MTSFTHILVACTSRPCVLVACCEFTAKQSVNALSHSLKVEVTFRDLYLEQHI